MGVKTKIGLAAGTLVLIGVGVVAVREWKKKRVKKVGKIIDLEKERQKKLKKEEKELRKEERKLDKIIMADGKTAKEWLDETFANGDIGQDLEFE